QRCEPATCGSARPGVTPVPSLPSSPAHRDGGLLMKRSRFSPLLLAVVGLAVAAWVAGCSKKSAPTAPAPSSQITQQAADDLAGQFALTLSRQNGVPLSQVGGTSLQDLARGRAPAARLLGNGTQQVADEGSFSWSFSLRFFDADGNEQFAFDPATTA